MRPSVSEEASHNSSQNPAVTLRETTSPPLVSPPVSRLLNRVFGPLSKTCSASMRTPSHYFAARHICSEIFITSQHDSAARVLGRSVALVTRSARRSWQRYFLENKQSHTANTVRGRYRTFRKGAPPLRRDTVALEASEKVESNAHSTKYATTVIGKIIRCATNYGGLSSSGKGLFPCRELVMYNVALKLVQTTRF